MGSTLGLNEALRAYVGRVGVREHPVLARCRAETAALGGVSVMQISPEQGAFMGLLARLLGARRYLEIGTFTGYSALAVALALPGDGRAVALDISEDFMARARGYWKEAGMAARIEGRVGPALPELERMRAAGEGPFDFVFIDADKTGYDAYYERALDLVRPGGLIALDNMLWDGKVVDESDATPDTRAIRALNEKIRGDARVDMALATVGDGIMLAVKR